MERGLWEGHYARRLSDNAPVYLAAVIQYLTAKILELAVEEADNNGGERIITPRMLQTVIRNDVLLSALFRNTLISQVAPGPN
ncbi:Histone H2A-Bbd type 2/3 [Saguinus oedipus]|uniref:Histone H2A n=1 Tax=Saguinus oedipus TaxID=9490 RepID=A0ABQ9TFP8_SAGOE|nr:Histone H2A-Bbd type 2/3 [Saguinus oedipus]